MCKWENRRKLCYLRRGLPEPDCPAGSRWGNESVGFLKWPLWPGGWKKWQQSKQSCPEWQSHSHVCASGHWCSCHSLHRKIWRSGCSSSPLCPPSVCPCWSLRWTTGHRGAEADGEDGGSEDGERKGRSRAAVRLALFGELKTGMPSPGPLSSERIQVQVWDLQLFCVSAAPDPSFQPTEKITISLERQTQILLLNIWLH